MDDDDYANDVLNLLLNIVNIINEKKQKNKEKKDQHLLKQMECN